MYNNILDPYIATVDAHGGMNPIAANGIRAKLNITAQKRDIK